jgi:Domain of unknown function (DUF4157)
MKTRTQTSLQTENAPTVTAGNAGLLQRQCACGGKAGLTGQCAQCRRSDLVGDRPSLIQTKLRVNTPGDPYEQEADRVAAQVMRMPDPKLQKQAESKNENVIQTKPMVQRQTEEDEDEEVLQAKPLNGIMQRQAEVDDEEEELQTKAQSGRTLTAGPTTHAKIQTLKGGGQPLPRDTRSFFESRMGHDFSHIRIHASNRAAGTAESLQAKAYTLGNNIVFNSGQYAPDSYAGKQLLAHELTHVIQQTNGLKRIQRKPRNRKKPRKRLSETERRGLIKFLSEQSEQLFQNSLEKSKKKGDLSNLKGAAKGRYEKLINEVKDAISKVDKVTPELGREARREHLVLFRKLLNDKFFVYPFIGFDLEHASKSIKKSKDLADPAKKFDIENLKSENRRMRSGTKALLRSDAREVALQQLLKGLKKRGIDVTREEFEEVKEGEAKEGEGGGEAKEGEGGGEAKEGEGGGETKEGEVGGETKEGEVGGETPGSGKAGTETEKQKTDQEKLEKFHQDLKDTGVSTTGGSKEETNKKIISLDDAAREDLIRLLIETSKTKGEPIDFKTFVDWYAGRSPSERELMRLNLELATSKTAPASELPEKLKLSLEDSAKTTAEGGTGAGKNIKKINEKLADLAVLSASVKHETLIDKEGASLEEIDLDKMPIFMEMMMFEGLLAGAATRSTEIEGIAKDLTANIANIRSFVFEEIAWLAGELAVGTILSALLAPVSGGASLVAAGARGALLLRRLNKLRLLIQNVEKVYSTYQTIRSTSDRIVAGLKKYDEFKGKYNKWSRELERLNSMLESASLEEDIEEQIDEIEGKLIEEIQKRLDEKGDFGALMENFFIPEEIASDEEALKEILFNIPRGIEALKELRDFYDKSKHGDMEYIRTLAFKSTRVGILLYPFVGFLALKVNNALSDLMREKTLGERILGIFTRSTTGKGKRKLPGRKKTRARLSKVKKKKTKKKKAETKKRKEEKKETAPKDVAKRDKQWGKVIKRVKKLHRKHGTRGITKVNLLKEARKISKKYRKVSGGPKVTEVSNRGEWHLSITRSDNPSKAIKRNFVMSEKTRWEKGKKALVSALGKLKDDQRSTDDIKKQIKSIKKAFKYSELKVEHRTKTKKMKGWYIFGKMGKRKLTQLYFIADTSNLHKGTESDPIPVRWYKGPSNYPTNLKLKLPKDSAPKNYPRNSTEKIKYKGKSIRIGFNQDYLINKCDTIKRGSINKRSGTIQKNYREALKMVEYGWRGNKGKTQDADHVTDLGFGGYDTYENLWPLDSKLNRWAYSGDWYRSYKVEFKDETNPNKSKVKKLSELSGKYFRVVSFKPTLPKGITGQWPGWKKKPCRSK